MIINFQQLRAILKGTGIKVYRDSAPSNAKYPYIIYEFVSEPQRRASSKVFASLPLYQIAYITTGVEDELETLKKALNENRVSYDAFNAAPYDENDDTVTQFTTYVRCIQ